MLFASWKIAFILPVKTSKRKYKKLEIKHKNEDGLSKIQQLLLTKLVVGAMGMGLSSLNLYHLFFI